MSARIHKAFGYQGDNMNLPVADVNASLAFYRDILGFEVRARSEQPNAVVLARDDVQMRIVENGGDPTQDGCAFHVTGLEALFAEFQQNGLNKAISDFDTEEIDGDPFKVFYAVAPDGLCFWFGERLRPQRQN